MTLIDKEILDLKMKELILFIEQDLNITDPREFNILINELKFVNDLTQIRLMQKREGDLK